MQSNSERMRGVHSWKIDKHVSTGHLNKSSLCTLHWSMVGTNSPTPPRLGACLGLTIFFCRGRTTKRGHKRLTYSLVRPNNISSGQQVPWKWCMNGGGVAPGITTGWKFPGRLPRTVNSVKNLTTETYPSSSSFDQWVLGFALVQTADNKAVLPPCASFQHYESDAQTVSRALDKRHLQRISKKGKATVSTVITVVFGHCGYLKSSS